MASYFLKEFIKALQLPRIAPMASGLRESHDRTNRLRAFANTTQGVKILQFDRNKYGR